MDFEYNFIWIKFTFYLFLSFLFITFCSVLHWSIQQHAWNKLGNPATIYGQFFNMTLLGRPWFILKEFMIIL